MVLVLDNLDSFTYNLVQALQGLGSEVLVRRVDRCSLSQLKRLRPARLVLSPGPGRPESSPLALQALRHYSGRIPVLGVCLGHQALGLAFGARLRRARRLLHGKVSRIRHDGQGVFRGLPEGFVAGRYHSWLLDPSHLGPALTATAWSEHGELMGLRHRDGAEGVQFHPESILTPCGPRLLANFLRSR